MRLFAFHIVLIPTLGKVWISTILPLAMNKLTKFFYIDIGIGLGEGKLWIQTY